MNSKWRNWALLTGVFVIALLTAIPLFAHHGGASLYDVSKQVTVNGTVTEFLWINPHVEITVEAKDEKGVLRHWLFEESSPPVLVNRGWNRKSLAAGDAIKVTFNPSRKGTNVGRMLKLIKADGTELK
jgi:uncharacterized protein DUF6152